MRLVIRFIVHESTFEERNSGSWLSRAALYRTGFNQRPCISRIKLKLLGELSQGFVCPAKCPQQRPQLQVDVRPIRVDLLGLLVLCQGITWKTARREHVGLKDLGESRTGFLL